MKKAVIIFKVLFVLVLLTNATGAIASTTVSGIVNRKDYVIEELEALNIRCRFSKKYIKIEIQTSMNSSVTVISSPEYNHKKALTLNRGIIGA